MLWNMPLRKFLQKRTLKSDFKVKDVSSIQKGVKLTQFNIELAKLMARRYFCNISDCIKLMLPPGTSTKVFENRIKDKTLNFVYLKKDILDIEEDIENKVIKSDKQKRVLNFLIQNDGIHTVDLEILTDVLKELDGLKMNQNSEVAFKARHAAVVLSRNLAKINWNTAYENEKIIGHEKEKKLIYQ